MAASPPMLPTIPLSELSTHNTLTSLWLAIDGVVYDLTEFAPNHPGGLSVLLQHAGKDATAAYSAVHPPTLIRTMLPPSKQVGRLLASPPSPPPSPPSNNESATAGPVKPPLSSLISVNDFRLAAHSFLPAKTLAFISSAATDTHTHRRNAATYADITLRPRVLVDVSGPVSLATSMLGQRVASPVFVAPTSLGKTVHPEGELEIARACAALGGVAQVVSTSASFSVADVVRAATATAAAAAKHSPDAADGPPVFLQLYVDKQPANTEALLRDAVRAGIKGVFLTVDAPVPGKREADERVPPSPPPSPSSPSSPSSPGPSADYAATPMAPSPGGPPTDARGSALGRHFASYISPSLTWARTLPWLRSLLPASVPLVVKGVQTAADAVRAAEAGADGIVVSNHGGRSLDTSPAAVLVLLELQRCCPAVFDRLDVFVDGGVSRGTDVFKALCLGARAVGVGRGVMYGLGWGREGVERVLQSEFFFFFFSSSSSSSCGLS